MSSVYHFRSLVFRPAFPSIELSTGGVIHAFETCTMLESAFPRSTAGQWASDTSALAKSQEAHSTVFER
jgi:hypothetical protein